MVNMVPCPRWAGLRVSSAGSKYFTVATMGTFDFDRLATDAAERPHRPMAREMAQFVTLSLKGKGTRTEDEWRDLVRQNWSMKCEFHSDVRRELVMWFWFMGDLRFETADLSGQRWTWLPGPGGDKWRSGALVLLLVESGTIEFEQSGAKVALTEGSLLLFDASIAYIQTALGEARVLALRLSKASLERRGLVLRDSGMFVPDLASPDVAVLKSLIAGAAAHGEKCTTYNKGLIVKHLVDLMEIITNDLRGPRRLRGSDAKLREIKRYIELNVGDEGMNVERVATAMGVSRRYLAKLFQRDGSSMMRYLMQQRLEQAKRLLISDSDGLRVREVARKCGFVSAAHFSNAFKKQYGVRPTALQPIR
jgi:AraC-like DNA-binding protein